MSDMEMFSVSEISALRAELATERAAVARAREEQREACARQFESCMPGGPVITNGKAANVRATPLEATPLGDENAALRARVAELEARLTEFRGKHTGNDWIRIYDERKALRATQDELVALVRDVLDRPMVEAEGTNPLVVTIHIAAERVEKWRAVLAKVQR